MKDRKERGIHYTPEILAEFVASQILNAWFELSESAQSQVKVFDPAVGDGQLVFSILHELVNKTSAKINVFGLDTDLEAIQVAQERVTHTFPNISFTLSSDDFIDFIVSNYAPTQQLNLFSSPSTELFDLVIANPPYVRTQVIGSKKAQDLANQFGLSGRVDLYYAFIMGIAEVLKPGGIAGIIVSNRFLTTKSGASVRKAIAEKFQILHIWDLGDTKLFEAAVLPSVLLVRRNNGQSSIEKPQFTSIYSTSETSTKRVNNLMIALSEKGIVEAGDGGVYSIQQGTLDFGDDPSQVWRVSTEESSEWLACVKNRTYCTFGEIGKIRVGVKTTADRVFIRSDWYDLPEDQRPELLKPLITHHVARRFKSLQGTSKQREILYTHEIINGKRRAVRLNEYPHSSKYLNSHRQVLEKRDYLRDAGRNWYEIWVPQNPGEWSKPKIVFRDIAEKPTFWLDLSGAVVNGDCYWFTCRKPEHTDLLWLALAVGNSSFIETFYDYKFNNKLYAGRRRFITQYVEKFPLPDPQSEIARSIIDFTKKIYDSIDTSSHITDLENQLDDLVWQAFGLPVKEIAG